MPKMKPLPCFRSATLALGLLTLLSNTRAAEINRFFAMDTAFRDGRPRSALVQASFLRDLGYDGFGTSGYPDEDFLGAFEKRGVTVVNTYLTLAFDASKPGLDTKLMQLVPQLRRHGTALWIAIGGVTKAGVKLKPSAVEGDEVVVSALIELAALAGESGVKIALYPHAGSWLERVDDADRLVKKLNRPNVGVTFNLCHWLKVEGDRDPLPVLKQALPHLYFVTINGAESGDTKKMDWNKLI